MIRSLNNAIVLTAVGFLLLLGSIPSDWMTIRNPTFTVNGMSNEFMSMPTGMAMKVTGMNGHLTLGMRLPIWLVVSIAAIFNLLTILNASKVTTLPSFAVLLPGIVSAIYLLAGFFVSCFSDQASPQIGVFLALLGLACGFFTFLSTRRMSDRAL